MGKTKSKKEGAPDDTSSGNKESKTTKTKRTPFEERKEVKSSKSELEKLDYYAKIQVLLPKSPDCLKGIMFADSIEKVADLSLHTYITNVFECHLDSDWFVTNSEKTLLCQIIGHVFVVHRGVFQGETAFNQTDRFSFFFQKLQHLPHSQKPKKVFSM